MPFQSALKGLLTIVEDHKSSVPVHVFFDLDSTLFSVRRRTQTILRQFADEYKDQFPEQTRVLRNIELLDTDWGIKSALIRSGISFDLNFGPAVRDYWKLHFFSSTFLHLDDPYPGAVQFVQRLASAGAVVSYLTGRDRHRMGSGTIDSLRAHGFPLDTNANHLMMKPSLAISDVDYKEAVFAELFGIPSQESQFQTVRNPSHSSAPPVEALIASITDAENGTDKISETFTNRKFTALEPFKIAEDESPKLWFLENEPVILHRILNRQFPINCIFVDSVHSGRALAPDGIAIAKPDYRLIE